MECTVCKFNNPKASTGAIIIRDSKILLVKRSEEPHRGRWDLPGGYVNVGELPSDALRREVKEELGVECNFDLIGLFPGTASWKGQEFAVINHIYLIELLGDNIRLSEENSDYQWTDFRSISPNDQAFDSNRDAIRYVKEKMGVDFEQVKKLIDQLDAAAKVSEINFYRSLLNGYCSRKYVDGKLVGLGWIYSRQTLLRKQAVIEDMIVDGNQRGKGLGKEIVLDLIRWAEESGVQVIELTSNPKRVAANALYQRVGFQLHPTNHYLYRVV